MKKSELIENTNKIFKKLENALNNLEDVISDVRNAFNLVEVIPEEAKDIEEDEEKEVS